MSEAVGAFESLPVIDSLVNAVLPEILSRLATVGIIGCQHLLNTTGSLIQALCRNGSRSSSVFLLGKVYSTNPAVSRQLRQAGCYVIDGSSPDRWGHFHRAIQNDADALWKVAHEHYRREGIRDLIVLDDGAVLHSTMPEAVRKSMRVVGIEQTTFGIAHNILIKNSVGIPVVNVASSAAKRVFEPNMICAAVLQRVQALLKVQKGTSIGVIGLGKIGMALARSLLRSGRPVAAYDRNSQRTEALPHRARCSSVQDVIAKSDIVFGCSGANSVTLEDLAPLTGVKTFASCSSGDVEFQPILAGLGAWVLNEVSPCPTLEGCCGDDEKLQIRMFAGWVSCQFRQLSRVGSP